MSALTRWWPAVATVSPSVSGRPSKLRFSASARALQADIVLRRGEDDAGRRLGLGLLDFDEIARADPGIGALQAVEADDVEPLVVAIGADGAGRGRALADDLDDVALGQAQLLHQLDGQPGDPAAAVGRGQIGDLQPRRHLFGIRHVRSSLGPDCPAALTVPAAMGSMWALAARIKGGGREAQKKAGR